MGHLARRRESGERGRHDLEDFASFGGSELGQTLDDGGRKLIDLGARRSVQPGSALKMSGSQTLFASRSSTVMTVV